MTIIDQFQAIFEQFAAISVKTHPMHVDSHPLYQEHLLVVVAALKYGAENEGAILVFDKNVIILKDLFYEVEYKYMLAIFN